MSVLCLLLHLHRGYSYYALKKLILHLRFPLFTCPRYRPNKNLYQNPIVFVYDNHVIHNLFNIITMCLGQRN